MDGKSKYLDIVQIKAVMDAWSDSSMTQTRFCAENNLSIARFQYWRRIYKKYQASEHCGESFIPVRIRNKGNGQFREVGSAEMALEIIWPNGKRVILPQLPDTCWLQSLLN